MEEHVALNTVAAILELPVYSNFSATGLLLEAEYIKMHSRLFAQFRSFPRDFSGHRITDFGPSIFMTKISGNKVCVV